MSVHRLRNIYKCNMNKWLNWKPECSNSKLAEMEQDEFSQNEAVRYENIKNQSVKEASLNARKILFPDVHIPDKDLRIVYELYRTAVIEGSALYQCKDEEQAIYYGSNILKGTYQQTDGLVLFVITNLIF